MMRWLGNKVIYDLRTTAYAHLQKLSLVLIPKKIQADLYQEYLKTLKRLQDFIVNSIQEFVMDAFMLIGMSVILFHTNWKLAALTLHPIAGSSCRIRVFREKNALCFP